MELQQYFATSLAKNIITSVGEDSAKALLHILDQKNLPPIQAGEQPVTGCQYIITRGEKKGQQCAVNLTSGDQFCAKHKKTSNKQKGPKKPAATHTQQTTDEMETVESVLEITQDFRGRYREPKSGFLFSDETTVYGKATSDGDILPLNKKDLMIVGLHGWSYKPE